MIDVRIGARNWWTSVTKGVPSSFSPTNGLPETSHNTKSRIRTIPLGSTIAGLASSPSEAPRNKRPVFTPGGSTSSWRRPMQRRSAPER